MNRTRVGIIVILVAATFGAAALALRSLIHPPGALLLPESGAQWVRLEAPFSLHHSDVEMRQVLFRREFSVAGAPESAQLRVRTFRAGVVTLNDRRIESSTGDYEVAALLRPGHNRLEVLVANDRGPPALLVASEDLDVTTPTGWSAAAGAEASGRAVPVSERPPFEASRRYPSAPASLLATLPFLLVFFLAGAAGSLLLARFIRAEHVRWALIAAWVVLCGNNLWKIPVLVGFDAASHYDYIAFLLEQGRLPLATDGWAMFHPPLFYLIAALPTAFAAGRLEPESTAMLLRLLPMLCGLAQIEIAYRCSRLAFPDRNDLQIVGTVVGGFLPMNVYMSQTVGNEPLSGVVTALLILRGFELLAVPPRQTILRACVGLGLLFGLALLTKTSVIVLLPVFVALIVHVARSRGAPARAAAQASGAFLGTGALVAGWWYLRNWILLGRPFVGGWEAGRGFDWWQDPGYRVPEDAFHFGESLVHPLFASQAGFWDALYSTLWLDGFVSLVTIRSDGPAWNLEFMLAMALLAIPLTLAGLAGAVFAFRRRSTPSGGMGVFSVACLGSFAAALLFVFLDLPAYSAAKSSYALGLLPCFAVLMTSGIAMIPGGPVIRASLSGYLVAWLAFTFVAYFAP